MAAAAAANSCVYCQMGEVEIVAEALCRQCSNALPTMPAAEALAYFVLRVARKHERAGRQEMTCSARLPRGAVRTLAQRGFAVLPDPLGRESVVLFPSRCHPIMDEQ
jgi:hypothetical protein